MHLKKLEFIEFLLQSKALLFGEFTLKSGRVSPYFFNLGCLNSGKELFEIGKFYAQNITDHFGEEYDIIFGPAYKGIPLSVATTVALYDVGNVQKRYCSNRKEAKGYGDASMLLGSALSDGDRIIMVDDVVTTGETKFEAIRILTSLSTVQIRGLIVALDRMEIDEEGRSAVQSFMKKTGIMVYSIVTITDVITYLKSQKHRWNELQLTAGIMLQMETYLCAYGISGLA